jgi:predicted Rossmann fold nucleotide-binding protein DprA/Smf involved in DNA uptake
MNNLISQNTQAILLLTAPLIVGKKSTFSDLLTLSEYNKLARYLHEIKQQPSDLLLPDAEKLIHSCGHLVDIDRMKKLIGRGFLLSQVINQWQDRSIWVVSRADSAYPRRIKNRLKEEAPPVLYGCGNLFVSNTEGLAVVGSREVDELLVNYTKEVAQLSAKAGKTIFSGGARGIDQAAMNGALEATGNAVGVLADSLEKTVLNRAYRDPLIEERLLLLSPYDPKAGFNVGNAMNRNKLIYALADAALIVNSDFNKGGTWTGAVEQLTKFNFSPVYIRSTGEASKGLDALRRKGALSWPNPKDAKSFVDILAIQRNLITEKPLENLFKTPETIKEKSHTKLERSVTKYPVPESANPAEDLFVKVRELIIDQLVTPKSNDEIADILRVSNTQAKIWLERLVDEKIVLKRSKPKGYILQSQLTLSSRV